MVNAATTSGWTALMTAAENGQVCFGTILQIDKSGHQRYDHAHHLMKLGWS